MKIIIAGGSGFLGNSLEIFFSKKRYEVIILSRNPKRKNELLWDAQTLGDWVKALENCDLLVNLTGKSIDCRHTAENKKEILESRIKSTEILQKAVDLCKNPPKNWFNASSTTSKFDEESNDKTKLNEEDFPMEVCQKWEETFYKKATPNVRKVAIRTAVVLGNSGGAFSKLKTLTKYGLGGYQGNGKQYMSWIHVQDYCRGIEYIFEKTTFAGSLNFSAPTPVTNDNFMKSLQKVVGISFGIPAPTFMLKIGAVFMNTDTALILNSRYMYPKHLLENGFTFNYPTTKLAFEELEGFYK